VRTAPLPFLVCTLIATAVTCTACYWFVDHLYAAALQSDAATLLTVREERDRANRDNDKLSKQVEGLRIYRSNDSIPLKKKALILAQQIRDFTKDWKDDDPPAIQQQNGVNYWHRFGLRASLIRDDSDQNGQQSDAFDKVMFEFTDSYADIRAIASEIQKLAEKLPD
jgi:hypothetical protein